jgi:SMC interacting uncharacterized protein involved in chromosome segregation
MVTKKRGLTNEELKTEILEQVIGEMRTEIEDLKTENKNLKDRYDAARWREKNITAGRILFIDQWIDQVETDLRVVLNDLKYTPAGGLEHLPSAYRLRIRVEDICDTLKILREATIALYDGVQNGN